jgi:hypothetical protein
VRRDQKTIVRAQDVHDVREISRRFRL